MLSPRRAGGPRSSRTVRPDGRGPGRRPSAERKPSAVRPQAAPERAAFTRHRLVGGLGEVGALGGPDGGVNPEKWRIVSWCPTGVAWFIHTHGSSTPLPANKSAPIPSPIGKRKLLK